MKKAYLTLDPPREPDGTLCRTGLRRSAPVVLLPGDPQRSRKMAALFAEASFTAHRGTFATYTGKTPGGADIAVTSSGMGCACVAAALEELAAAGAEAVIRVGTCGGVQPDLAPGTIVIASGCVRGEGASYELVPPEFPAVADPLLVRALCSAAQELDEPVRVGLYRSHDAFYMESKAAHPGLRERMQKWIDTGVLVVENESGLLFTYGHLLGLRAASICVALGSMFADPNANVYGAVPPELIIREHDALMAVDIENGQKTGHFLDQQENRGHLRPYSAGRTVLDLCCHTGGFSIHAALYGAARVQAVDVSETALAMVRGNAARNGVADRVETVCANVFDLVRQGCEEGRQFGLVICDPPAFAKSRSALDGAYRGYRELNRRCMQLTEPGGFLVTCSCSQFMTQPLFEQMLTEAAKGAGRQVRLLERLMQSRDHPATLGEEHSMYLKGCILQVL